LSKARSYDCEDDLRGVISAVSKLEPSANHNERTHRISPIRLGTINVAKIPAADESMPSPTHIAEKVVDGEVVLNPAEAVDVPEEGNVDTEVTRDREKDVNVVVESVTVVTGTEVV